MAQTFGSHTLTSRVLSITVVPEIGAKIVSFRNLLTGREWMWRPRPAAELFRNQGTDPFDASPLVGADECLPTIESCRHHGVELPDHGEVWQRPWNVDLPALQQNCIRTHIALEALPLELERSIWLRENEAIFDYVLTSRSSKPETFLWAFHPLMPLEDEFRIELPPEIRFVQIGALDGFAMPADGMWNWPSPLPGVDLDRLHLGLQEPGYVKLFANFTGVSRGFAAIQTREERLLFRFEPAQIPILGLWITRGGWNGYTHIALEPTNAASDSLCDIVADNYTTITPGQRMNWSFRMILETA